MTMEVVDQVPDAVQNHAARVGTACSKMGLALLPGLVVAVRVRVDDNNTTQKNRFRDRWLVIGPVSLTLFSKLHTNLYLQDLFISTSHCIS